MEGIGLPDSLSDREKVGQKFYIDVEGNGSLDYRLNLPLDAEHLLDVLCSTEHEISWSWDGLATYLFRRFGTEVSELKMLLDNKLKE